MVMSLMTLRDDSVVVAVLSNIAHANTSALGVKIGDTFARQPATPSERGEHRQPELPV
jgi:hypothetical protein